MQNMAEEISAITVDHGTCDYEKLLQDFIRNGGRITPAGLGINFGLGTNTTLLQSIHCEIMGSEEGRAFLRKIQTQNSTPRKLTVLK